MKTDLISYCLVSPSLALGIIIASFLTVSSSLVQNILQELTIWDGDRLKDILEIKHIFTIMENCL